VTDRDAGEREQAEAGVGAAFVAGAQPPGSEQPGGTAFDDPAGLARAAAVGGSDGRCAGTRLTRRARRGRARRRAPAQVVSSGRLAAVHRTWLPDTPREEVFDRSPTTTPTGW